MNYEIIKLEFIDKNTAINIGDDWSTMTSDEIKNSPGKFKVVSGRNLKTYKYLSSHSTARDAETALAKLENRQPVRPEPKEKMEFVEEKSAELNKSIEAPQINWTEAYRVPKAERVLTGFERLNAIFLNSRLV